MIGIIDSGNGNIVSIEGAYAALGIPTERIISASQICRQSHIVLPGVGSFDDTMTRYHQLGFASAIEDAVGESDVRVLGICIGLQVMCVSSEEGQLPGLGLINATVRKLHPQHARGKLLQPHMGWNKLTRHTHHPLVAGLNSNELDFFFLHSYYLSSLDEATVIATCVYGPEIPSIIAAENVFGMQFHPEKSHSQGLRLLKNFSNI